MGYAARLRGLRMVLLLLSCGSASIWAAEWAPPNLVDNPGFESLVQDGFSAGWVGARDVYGRDTSVKRSGDASLKYVNADAGKYVLCSRTLPLEAGMRYELSAWVKTEGVDGDESGATICIEYSDAAGKYLGGSYPVGAKGTNDWTQVKGLTERIPENAKTCSISCYLRKGMTGTAWWDDVEVRRHRDDPLSIVLLAPSYRGELFDGGPEDIRLHVNIDLTDYAQTMDDVALLWQITGKEHTGNAALGTMDRFDLPEFDFSIHAKDLRPGPYQVNVILRDKESGEQLSAKSCQVTKLDANPRCKAYIDEHNRLILNGQPFFPLGMYWGGIQEDELDVYADSAFNCLMPYQMPSSEQMDMAHERGLKVIYSVKDCYHGTGGCPAAIKSQDDELAFIREKAEQFREHPALMAWYINDELSLAMLDRLTLHRQWMEELDPDHPTWVVLYQVDDVRAYMPTFHVIGTDPYPIPSKPASTAAEWTRKTVDAVGGARAVWMVPQVFSWSAYKGDGENAEPNRPPTFEEMRSMTWQCIAQGAHGIIYYSWFDIRRDERTDFKDHWPKVKSIAKEVKDMAPALLSVEKAPKIDAPAEPWLNWTSRRLGDKAYLIAVNNSTEARSAAFELPSKPDSVRDVCTGERPAVEDGRALRLDFAPLEVHICEIEGLRRWF